MAEKRLKYSFVTNFLQQSIKNKHEKNIIQKPEA